MPRKTDPNYDTTHERDMDREPPEFTKQFTAADKLACVQRELRMRLKVYPRWIEIGKMKLDQAQWETDVMRAIVRDYEKTAENERLL